MSQKFQPGEVYITAGAEEALGRNQQYTYDFLWRHVQGDWGDMPEEDKESNDESIKAGGGCMSAYKLKDGTAIWVITEADRSSSTILLPEEY